MPMQSRTVSCQRQRKDGLKISLRQDTTKRKGRKLANICGGDTGKGTRGETVDYFTSEEYADIDRDNLQCDGNERQD